jgi:hypothetical protein
MQEGVLTGDVFIVTKGGQNFKLGLVEVTAIPEDKMRPFVLKKQEVGRSAVEKFKTEQGAAQRELDAVLQEYDALKRATDEAEARRRATEETYDRTHPETHPETFDPNYNPFAWSEAKQHATQWATDEVIKVRKQATAKQSELSTIQAKMIKQQVEFDKTVGDDFLFADLPSSDTKATTDAEGRFAIKVPANGRFAIAARAQRSVVDSTEHYYWLIWVSLNGEKTKQVMLSNNNLTGAESKDSVFNLNALLKDASDKEP